MGQSTPIGRKPRHGAAMTAGEEARLAELAVEQIELRLAASTDGLTGAMRVAGIRDDDASVSDMIGRADQAMYEAKVRGHNRSRLAPS